MPTLAGLLTHPSPQVRVLAATDLGRIGPAALSAKGSLQGALKDPNAQGRAATETANREWNQYAAEALYRFLPNEKLFVGARYNTVEGDLTSLTNEVGIDRWQYGAGWFITGNLLLKAEYVTQKYNDFPVTDIRRGGKFNGFVVEGVVAF